MACLVLLFSSSTGYQILSRRTAVCGAVACAARALTPPAFALEEEELKSILQRADSNTLQTDKVIDRAKRNDMVSDFKQVDCGALEGLIEVDKKALNIKTKEAKKLKKEAAECVDESSCKAEVLRKEKMKEIVLLEKRIREQVERLSAEQFSRSICLGGTL